MALRIPTTASDFASWLRQAAPSLNAPREYPYEHLPSAPANPAPGRTYFDTGLNKVRTYANGIWNNHF